MAPKLRTSARRPAPEEEQAAESPPPAPRGKVDTRASQEARVTQAERVAAELRRIAKDGDFENTPGLRQQRDERVADAQDIAAAIDILEDEEVDAKKLVHAKELIMEGGYACQGGL